MAVVKIQVAQISPSHIVPFFLQRLELKMIPCLPAQQADCPFLYQQTFTVPHVRLTIINSCSRTTINKKN